MLDAYRERLARDPLLVGGQLGGQGQGDPIGDLEAELLAHRVDLVDRLARAALELEVGVELEVERDRQTVLAGDCPALLAAPLDEHLLRRELVTVDPQPTAVELLEIARLELCAHGAELLAELGPEDGQVRLHPQLSRLDLAELDLLHA